MFTVHFFALLSKLKRTFFVLIQTLIKRKIFTSARGLLEQKGSARPWNNIFAVVTWIMSFISVTAQNPEGDPWLVQSITQFALRLTSSKLSFVCMWRRDKDGINLGRELFFLVLKWRGCSTAKLAGLDFWCQDFSPSPGGWMTRVHVCGPLLLSIRVFA